MILDNFLDSNFWLWLPKIIIWSSDYQNSRTILKIVWKNSAKCAKGAPKCKKNAKNFALTCQKCVWNRKLASVENKTTRENADILNILLKISKTVLLYKKITHVLLHITFLKPFVQTYQNTCGSNLKQNGSLFQTRFYEAASFFSKSFWSFNQHPTVKISGFWFTSEVHSTNFYCGA